MPKLNQTEFSKLAGVSKVAISKMVNASPPRLILEDGKLDTDNPVNAIYLAGSHGPGRKPTAKIEKAKKVSKTEEKVRKAVKKHLEETDAIDESIDLENIEGQKKLESVISGLMGEVADLDLKKKKVDIALKIVMEKNHAFKLAKAKGEVIDREEFKRTAQAWNASLSQNVMRVPRRVMSRLWAMAKAGDELRSGELMLEAELSKAVSRALEGVAGAK